MADVRLLFRPEPSGKARKITKVVPYSSGGFALLMPYHREKRGMLMKAQVDYNVVGPYRVGPDEHVDYDASDRVKLSYHGDGFVQFSGENPSKIISGRDLATGAAKGLGLVTNPISNPIRTGPTFGVTAWGLDDFDIAENVGPSDIVFENDDLYYRGCDPDSANAYMIEAFVFPNRFWAGVRSRRMGGWAISLSHPNFEATDAVLEWRVVPLPGQPAFIGVCANRGHVIFSSASGFMMHGPGQRFPDGKGIVLQAVYPAPPRGPDRVRTILDRSTPQSPNDSQEGASGSTRGAATTGECK
jgi:hypothetical protein